MRTYYLPDKTTHCKDFRKNKMKIYEIRKKNNEQLLNKENK